MAKRIKASAAKGSALGALAAAWLQGKLAEHPPRLGWLDLAVIGGLIVGWLLGRGQK